LQRCPNADQLARNTDHLVLADDVLDVKSLAVLAFLLVRLILANASLDRHRTTFEPEARQTAVADDEVDRFLAAGD